PSTWHIIRNESRDSIWACNKHNGQCTATGAIPLAGTMFISLVPAEKIADHPPYRSARDIVSASQPAGSPPPTISVVTLGQDAARNKKCFVARSLWFGDMWDETYGIEVKKNLFS